MSLESNALDVLNDLLKNAHDGARSYRIGVEEVSTPLLKEKFATLANYHEQTAHDLTNYIAAHGGEPSDGGTVAGALHRGWLKVKTAVGADSDLSILEEAERGEDGNVARYRKAIKEDLPVEVQTVVNRLAANAQRSHDEIKALRDQAKAARQ